MTYFFPIEEVNNCFQVINQGVILISDDAKIRTGSSENIIEHVFYGRKQ